MGRGEHIAEDLGLICIGFVAVVYLLGVAAPRVRPRPRFTPAKRL